MSRSTAAVAAVTPMTCGRCGHKWTTKAAVGTKGIRCTACGHPHKVKATIQPVRAGGPRAKGAGKPPVPVPAPAPGWNPPAIPVTEIRADAGTCECGTDRTWAVAGQGTMTHCPACGAWALPPGVAGAHGGGAGQPRPGTTREERRASDQEIYRRAERLYRIAQDAIAETGDEEDRADLRLALDDIRRARSARSPSMLEEAENYLAGLIDLGDEDLPGDDDGAGQPAHQVLDGTAMGVVVSRHDDIGGELDRYRQGTGGQWPAGLPRPPAALTPAQTGTTGQAGSVSAMLADGGLAELDRARQVDELTGFRRTLVSLAAEAVGQRVTYAQLTGYRFTPPEGHGRQRVGLFGRRRELAAPDPSKSFYDDWDAHADIAARRNGARLEAQAVARRRGR